MDGLNLYASVKEIAAYTGAKIDKIQQPEKDELLFTLRYSNGNPKLLINASAMNCRIQLTDTKRQNPIEPPMFCMLLRKRLGGGRILSVTQPDMDRVVDIVVEAQNELGDMEKYTLTAEIMGKHSNIILVGGNGTIVDAARRVSPGMSNKRLVLPGLTYERPPKQDKRPPVELMVDELEELMNSAVRPNKALSNALFGLSPNMAEELISALGGAEDTRRLALRLHGFYAALSSGEFTPYSMLNDMDEPVAVFPFEPDCEYKRKEPNLHSALDALYEQADISSRMQRHGASIHRILENNLDRCEKKLALYDDAINAEGDIEHLRLCGELITANLHKLKQGAGEAAVENYYDDPPTTLVIELSPQLSPNENAQKYYKKYQKARAARDMAKKHREETVKEFDYLESLADALTKCTQDAELEELRAELVSSGYIRPPKGKGKKLKKPPQSKPMRFLSSDGVEILVGKNNTQNDNLTLRVADGEDYWLHTKDIPGSHVIVRSPEPPQNTLYEAAVLAAYYSKARGGENIAVDFTKRKNVKKPAGAKPGMVIYLTNRTAYVTPDEALVKRLNADK